MVKLETRIFAAGGADTVVYLVPAADADDGEVLVEDGGLVGCPGGLPDVPGRLGHVVFGAQAQAQALGGVVPPVVPHDGVHAGVLHRLFPGPGCAGGLYFEVVGAVVQRIDAVFREE